MDEEETEHNTENETRKIKREVLSQSSFVRRKELTSSARSSGFDNEGAGDIIQAEFVTFEHCCAQERFLPNG